VLFHQPLSLYRVSSIWHHAFIQIQDHNSTNCLHAAVADVGVM